VFSAYTPDHPGPFLPTAGALSVLDRDVVDRSLSGSAGAAGLIARVSALWQSGYARLYALSMLLGLVVLIGIVAFSGVLA
jgi:hypothetical protein